MKYLKERGIIFFAIILQMTILVACGNDGGGNTTEPPESQEYFWTKSYEYYQDRDGDGIHDKRVQSYTYNAKGQTTGRRDVSDTSDVYDTYDYVKNGDQIEITIKTFNTADNTLLTIDKSVLENDKKIEYYETYGDENGDGEIDLNNDIKHYYTYEYDSQGRPFAKHQYALQRANSGVDINKITGYIYNYTTYEYNESDKIIKVNSYAKIINFVAVATFDEINPTPPVLIATDQHGYMIYEYSTSGKNTAISWYRGAGEPFSLFEKTIKFYNLQDYIIEKRDLEDLNSDGFIEDTETNYFRLFSYVGAVKTEKIYGDANNHTDIATTDDLVSIYQNTYRSDEAFGNFSTSGSLIEMKRYIDQDLDGVVSLNDNDLNQRMIMNYERHEFTDEQYIEQGIVYDNYKKYYNYRNDFDIRYYQ